MSSVEWIPRLAIPGGAVSAALLFAALASAVVLEWRRRTGPRLRALRVGTALLAWVLAVQPRWSVERVQESEGRLAVLVDGSRSMAVGADEPRSDAVRALLARWQGQREEVALHRFGSALGPAEWDDLAAATRARDDESRIAGAVAELVAGDGAGELGAVVVISDGADGERRAPGEAPAPLEMNGVKIHTVAVGADETLRDDAIAELQADPIAFLRQPGEVRVVVRSTGSGGLRVPVTLRQGDEVVTEALVAVPEGGEAEAVLSFTPRRLGRAVYRVSIPTAEDDAVPQNNERAFLVRVTRDRLRVLLVAGAPSWDVRFLRAFLKRDPSIDLISFFILRTTSDMTMASPDELALIPFPTDELFREHLGSFDVVVFQNFDYGPYQMAPYLPRIRDYVQRGGSFAMIGGDRSFGSGGYAGTPLAEILPVRLPRSDAPPSRLVAEGRFSPEVDAELVRHPLVALAPEPGASVAAWARLAPLEGLNRVEAVEEPAQVLLRRPGRERLPVLVVGEAEEGRVLALTTDTSWRWGLTTGGRSGDATAFERFWDRALRWLARDPALEPASVTTDRERYGPEARVRVRALLRDARYRPIALETVRLALVDEAGSEQAAVEVTTDGEGRAEAELEGPAGPGAYRAVALRAGERLAEEAFVVESGGDELADPRADPAYLEALAESAGGVAWGSPGAAPDLGAIDATRTEHLGSVELAPFASPWALLGALLLFAGEWWLRRRAGVR